jgi:hypothetical protein
MGNIISYIRKRRRKSSITPINYGDIELDVKVFDYEKEFPLCSPRSIEKIKKNDMDFVAFMNGSYKRWEERRLLSIKQKNPSIDPTKEEKYRILFFV